MCKECGKPSETVIQKRLGVGGQNDWTVMFFFAGDSDLSPSMIAQLKAIKEAGFQENTTVLIHFDPNERGAGTRTFEVNRKEKLEMATVIGDGVDPFVRNLNPDNIKGAPVRADAVEALRTFLDFGVRYRPAKHYLLFLVGHGMIVGNDAFLPDLRPDSAITLREIGEILWDFNQNVEKINGGTVELIGLHSCSMSALEVLFELKGTAKYLMSTQGISFVSSWPYRHVMKRILLTVGEYGAKVNVEKMVKGIHELCLRNSTDFMFSGLSADLSLCRLDRDTVQRLKPPIQDLTRALKNALEKPRGQEIVLLAHLKSQSYWQENYTDLYDFCLCLERECKSDGDFQDELLRVSKAMRTMLEETKGDGPVVQSDHFGPMYQYSHGLSIYFPWTSPVDDDFEDEILGRYRKYEFTKALGDDSWLSFLEKYFRTTERKAREVEDMEFKATVRDAQTNGQETHSALASLVTSFSESLDDGNKKVSPSLNGAGCNCQPIKNFPSHFSLSQRFSTDVNECRIRPSKFKVANNGSVPVPSPVKL